MGGGGYIISNGSGDITGLTDGVATASIVIGAIVSIISFLGCFGAANEKVLHLSFYLGSMTARLLLGLVVSFNESRDFCSKLISHCSLYLLFWKFLLELLPMQSAMR